MQSFIHLLSRYLLNPCFGIKHPIVNKIAKVTLFTELSTLTSGGASLRRHINKTNSVHSDCLSAMKEQCSPKICGTSVFINSLSLQINMATPF